VIALAAIGAVAAIAGALALALDARAINEALDRRTLRAMATIATSRPGLEAPAAPLPFTSAAELERLTRPDRPLAVTARPRARHRRDEPGLVEEELVFPSPVRVAHAESNEGRAYVYRRGPLGGRPVVLWVPGLYVIDLAFVPIGWFLDEILARDADVVLYVPPYHLDRTPAGFGSGDALLATTVPDQLAALAQELAELRGLVRWLRRQGVPRLGAFGGSLGGVMLLRLGAWDDGLDFLTVMMPPVSLDRVLLSPPELEPVRARLRAAGWPLDALAAGYRAFDATAALRLPGARVAVLAGAFDQIAPLADLRAWATRAGVTRLRAYPRGHASLLLQRRMYRDYGALLDEDLRAAR
jgi:hypothetical protein